MSIRAMAHMPYTEHRDFVALSADLSELPYDCGDGSTCIMSDTAQEYIFHKSENEWREETRPIPELAYRGEVKKIEQCYLDPAYGDMQLIRESPTSAFVAYWNGICWKELKREEKEIG